ncbi:MAG TPA: hypothetical protein VH187_08000 [Scandinavium sp.]|jgi:hypothetical protein|uniref:hypothetical protein n=1 Tax=Scandinavium sp. TaxID=2830653 RepID=UPI002E353633|nr:hypothetical protein [Scandinavium sp.]HEX4501087.1 hypothetical protein [Scandinavium sp.]
MSYVTPPGGGSIIAPEIAVPFTFDIPNGDVQQIEQGSDEDIVSRIWIVLSYEPGMFSGDPTFGIPQQVFRKGGADLNAIERAILNFVPDAQVIIERNLDWFATLVDQIQIRRNESDSPPIAGAPRQVWTTET